ncbi:MAG: glycosyltransferase, partial [Pseudomonadota bacterium]
MRPPICHINLAKHFRGGERQTELLVRELAAAGWPQRLIIRAGNPLGSRLEDVALLEQREVSSNPVAAALACRGASLVHAHEARAVYSGWLSSVLFRIPYVLTRRVVNPQKPSGFRERAYRRASAAVAVSQAAAA